MNYFSNINFEKVAKFMSNENLLKEGITSLVSSCNDIELLRIIYSLLNHYEA